MKKIVLTGGHLTPAVAIIEELQKNKEWQIYFIGRKFAFDQDKEPSFEYQTIKSMGVNFMDSSAIRLSKKLTFKNLYAAVIALFKALIYLNKINAEIILSFGGYVATPVLLAAIILKKPFILHEQTLRPGKSNLFFARFAVKILVSWKEALPFFPDKKTIFTGNPLRASFFKELNDPALNFFSPDTKNLPLIYFTGGSTGSHQINLVVAECLNLLLVNYKVIHQCGQSYFNDYEMLKKVVQKLDPSLAKHYFLAKNLNSEETSAILKSADIIVGRAGANTIVEIALLGKIAILIPHPDSAYNEQEINAKKLAENGGAQILEEKNLNRDNLVNSINNLWKEKRYYQNKALEYKKTDEIQKHKNAVSQIVNILNDFGNFRHSSL